MFVVLAPASVLAQCQYWMAGPFGVAGGDGVNGSISAMTLWDPDGPGGPKGQQFVVGGSFTLIQGTGVTNLAMLDATTGAWVQVGPGALTPSVTALTVFNGKLVVGSPGDNDVGTFDETVHTWDGVSWVALSATNTGSVRTMIVHNGELFVGGSFLTNFTTSTHPAISIARWNPGANLWDELGSQTTNGSVLAFGEWNGDLYVGGSFTLMGGDPHFGAVIWNGSGWTDLGLTAGSVNSFQPFFGGLYAGGSNLQAGATNMGGLGRVSGGVWSTAGGTFGGPVNRLMVYNGSLIIAGTFSNGGSPNIATYNGSSYGGLGAGIGTTVNAMFPYAGILWVGGTFTTAGGGPAQRFAKWNGTGWATVGGGTVGGVLAMKSFIGGLVVAGSFSQTAVGTQPAVNIAQWTGTSLNALGSGMNNQINALESFQYTGPFGSYELIAGGYFTSAGGVAANRIARWNVDPFGSVTSAWQAMGPGMDGAVLAIARYNNATYAGGNFFFSGGTALANIGRWNETTDQWENIVGSNGVVYAMKVYNGNLYVGGSFTQIGGISTGGLARYNSSTGWSNVGGFFLGSVYSLDVWNGLLVIGGDYTGINSSPDLAYYNGSSYGTFSTGGSNSSITAVHANGSRLYVGGPFTTIGGIAASHVGYWDGSWHAAGTGTDNTVYAFGAMGGEEQVGGTFTAAGGIFTPGFARFTATGLPWFIQQPFNQSVASGAHVTFTARPAPGYAIGSLQWYRKGLPAQDGPQPGGSTIVGSNDETLILDNVSSLDAGLYKLVITNGCGVTTSNEVTLTVDGFTAVDDDPPIASDAIEFVGPNPTMGAATMAFALAHEGRVQMRIHDLAGRVVRRIDAGSMSPGRHRLSWDGRDQDGLASRAGLYFVRLEVEGRSLGVRRLVLQH